jgi:prepilin-type N-terminal cleavage/methylation domain-containing protein
VKASRAGMTLFELLVVMTIVGIVYSVGIFTLKKEKVTNAKMSLSTLKTNLLALSNPNKLRMVCDTHGQCQVYSNDEKMITTLYLHSEGTIKRYGFNRFGELQLWGNVVAHTNKGLSQGCFEMSLRPDGTVNPLILKSNDTFYAYTPLGGDKPYITINEEALKNFIFNASLYPLAVSDTYGVQ